MKAKIEISLEVTKIDAENGTIEGKFYAEDHEQNYRADDGVIIAAIESLMSHMQVELENHPRKGVPIDIFTDDGGDLCSSEMKSGLFQVNVEDGTEVWLGGDEFVTIGEIKRKVYIPTADDSWGASPGEWNETLRRRMEVICDHLGIAHERVDDSVFEMLADDSHPDSAHIAELAMGCAEPRNAQLREALMEADAQFPLGA